jgi:phage-related baseplate assembly protein
MPLTLEQVRSITTRAEALDELITILQSLGFNTTAWQTGSVQLTLLEGCAEVWAQMSLVAASLSYFHFNDDATDEALTALSSSHYDNTRVAATRATGLVVVTGAAAGPPHVIAIGDMVVADSTYGYTYRNTNGFTVPISGVATPAPIFEAEVAGTDRNVADGAITILQTPYAGVTVNNPGPNWRTIDAVDEETDATLRLRNSSRWSTLSYATSADAYESMALAADSTVTRVYTDDTAASLGTVDVYLADNNGGVAAGVVTTVQTYIDLWKPITANVTVATAVEYAAQAFTATIYITASLNNSATWAAIEAARDSYINTLPIGGTVIPPGAQGYMLFSELNAAISSITGVENITWTVPTADVAIAATQVMRVGATTFTYTDI